MSWEFRHEESDLLKAIGLEKKDTINNMKEYREALRRAVRGEDKDIVRIAFLFLNYIESLEISPLHPMWFLFNVIDDRSMSEIVEATYKNLKGTFRELKNMGVSEEVIVERFVFLFSTLLQMKKPVVIKARVINPVKDFCVFRKKITDELN